MLRGVQAWLLALVLAGTIGALYLRPWGAKDWQVALAGGAAAWVLGPLGLRGGIEVAAESANIAAFFFGLMLVAAGAEAAGLYARVALLLGRVRGGRGRVAVVLGLGTLITAVLSNDATPLVLTPAIFVAGAATARATTDAAFAATFAADGASLLLPVSNPVNLLYYERFEPGFDGYLRTVTPAALAGIAAMAVVTWLRTPRERAAPEEARHLALERPAWPAMLAAGLLAVGYVVAGMRGWPLGAVTVAGGLAMGVAARAGGPIDARRYRAHIAPGVLVFVASLMVLAESVVQAGSLDWLGGLLGWLEEQPTALTIAGAAVAAAVLSNLVNNWPAALLLAATIGARPGEHEALVVGVLIGWASGANFTMVASLITVFWVSVARQHGASYGALRYARRAFLPTLAGMAAAVLAASMVVG